MVKESCGACVIPVMRRNGADGEISVKYRTIDKTAVGGKDYVPQEGTLIFRNNEVIDSKTSNGTKVNINRINILSHKFIRE